VKRLAHVVSAFGAPESAAEPLARILELQATDPGASTTVREVNEAIDRHVADSLVALSVPAVAAARRIADLGSGAGWPGLALAAALPDAHVWLVESAIRRCRYLETASEGLPNVSVVHARAEEWTDGIGAHDLVTARALASLNVILEYAAPLLAEGGHVVAWKAEVSAEEAADGAAAAELLTLEPVAVVPVQPFREARGRTLHVFRKAGPTPPRFPRRAGMATKRPLRAT
jgi:16S rRNA (guanine527-N7)-methyltransferase